MRQVGQSKLRSWLNANLQRRVPRRETSPTNEILPGEAQEDAPLNLVANVPDEQMYTWDTQAAQYPPTGPPGVSYFRGTVNDEVHVDCLLYRDEDGQLVGILNQYPVEIPPFERAGDKNIWVHPEHRRQGIATTLLLEAWFRWGPRDSPNPDGPRLTQSGVEFLTGLEERYRGSQYDFRDTGWDVWHERRTQELGGADTNWRDVGWEVWHKRQTMDHQETAEEPPPEADSNP